MTDEDFIRTIIDDPDDNSVRLVYADWLEEHGDPRGEFLRLQCALDEELPAGDQVRSGREARQQELRGAIDKEWLSLIEMGRVRSGSLTGLEKFTRLNTRPASVLTIGGFRPSRHPLATHFGLAPVSLPEEEWPCVAGRPLFFICQLNLTQAPFVPKVLRDLALITLFLDKDARRLGRENGTGWLLRAYQCLDRLRPLAIPKGATVPRGFEVQFHLQADHPLSNDRETQFPEGYDEDRVDIDHVYRTKIGGCASYIQSAPSWGARTRYCFQVASEDKVGLYWGDNGILYFARRKNPGHEARWLLETQCY